MNPKRSISIGYCHHFAIVHQDVGPDDPEPTDPLQPILFGGQCLRHSAASGTALEQEQTHRTVTSPEGKRAQQPSIGEGGSGGGSQFSTEQLQRKTILRPKSLISDPFTPTGPHQLEKIKDISSTGISPSMTAENRHDD